MPLEMQWEAVNIPEPGNPVGAKGVGEVAAMAGSAAVLCAIQNAIGNRCVLRTPVTPDRVLEALAGQGERPVRLAAYA
jgi:CO/xanthine dehydrogenase Mo-binding subunit